MGVLYSTSTASAYIQLLHGGKKMEDEVEKKTLSLLLHPPLDGLQIY